MSGTHVLNRYDSLRRQIHREVPELISLRREGPYWDFKREWHDNNGDLIHDILCLANNLEREVSYLIIGIDEDDDYSAVCVVANKPEKRKSCQSVVDMLSKTAWGNAQAPFVLVEPLEIDGKTIDGLAIVSQREDMPYFLAKPSGNVRAWMIHTRRVDQNTPIDTGANWSEVQKIWRHHFALDESPIMRLRGMLADKAHWRSLSEITGTDDKYYEFAPEFIVKHRPDDTRVGYEYYHLNQMDPRPSWYTIKIRYHQTVIYDTLGIALDGGSYFAPVPEWSLLRWSGNQRRTEADICYCYYLRDSLDWCLNEFLFDEDRHDAISSRERFLEMVLLFENEAERLSFEHVLKFDKNEFNRRYDLERSPCVDCLPKEYSDEGRKRLLFQAKAAVVLQGMLRDFREGTLVNEGYTTSRDWLAGKVEQ